MPNQFIGRYRDYDNDVKQTSVALQPTAVEADAVTLGATFNVWSAGQEGGQYFQKELLADSGNGSNSVIAQGKLRIVLEMVDDVTGKTFREFIPMPSLDKAADVGTNSAYIKSGGLTMLNPLHSDYVTMKSTLDTHWMSPAGNNGTLSRGYIEE